MKQGIESRKLKGKKILIVDDLQCNQVLGALFFKIAGAEVNVASNGVDAISQALSGNPDAILMDVHMPVLSGLAAAEHLRKEGFLNPIVIVSSDRRSELRQRALEVGANIVLSRPLTLETVVEVFSQCCCPEAPEAVETD